MKPQILLGLAATAMYTLSGCSQTPSRIDPQPKKITSHHVAYNHTNNITARKATPQRPVVQKRQTVSQRQIVPQHIAPQYTPQQPVQRQQSRPTSSGGMPALSRQEIRRIGDQIFANESGSDVRKLVHWNVGENFASMGIGHFTWYPEGRRARFGNTFPGMLTYLESRGVKLPLWLQQAKHNGAPWRTRAQLEADQNSPRVKQLQHILFETRYMQAEYIMQRAQRAMPKLVKTSPPHLRPMVANNLNAIANSRGGWYPLIDYVNFKGEGLNRHGGYRGQNWGLLQVLEEMRPAAPGQQALNEFSDAALRVLTRRIRNSPKSRGEIRWLAGWSNRVLTYKDAT